MEEAEEENKMKQQAAFHLFFCIRLSVERWSTRTRSADEAAQRSAVQRVKVQCPQRLLKLCIFSRWHQWTAAAQWFDCHLPKGAVFLARWRQSPAVRLSFAQIWRNAKTNNSFFLV